MRFLISIAVCLALCLVEAQAHFPQRVRRAPVRRPVVVREQVVVREVVHPVVRRPIVIAPAFIIR